MHVTQNKLLPLHQEQFLVLDVYYYSLVSADEECEMCRVEWRAVVQPSPWLSEPVSPPAALHCLRLVEWALKLVIIYFKSHGPETRRLVQQGPRVVWKVTRTAKTTGLPLCSWGWVCAWNPASSISWGRLVQASWAAYSLWHFFFPLSDSIQAAVTNYQKLSGLAQYWPDTYYGHRH